MNTPERQSPTEPLDIQQKTDAIRSGARPVERDYPYIPPDYRVPFLHIGTERQLFLDNFILDHLEGVRREVCVPAKTAEPLLAWSDLPWEQVQFNPGTAGVVHDPDDRLFKMWYWQGLTGHAFNEGQVLCYAESRDALRWEKPLRDDCLPFEGHKATNIVHPDVSQSGLALNHDRSDPDRKYLLVNWPPKAARVRPPGSPRLSRVDASPDGIRWQTISEESAFPHHHEQKIFWDGSIRRWVGFSQYSHHQNFLYRKRQIGRQESADFINWSPKEVALSADWDANLPPDLEMHDMSARKVGGLYIGITSEFMAEPFWQERDGHNWRDQAFSRLGLYTSRDGRRWQRVGGPGPWVDTGDPGDQDYGFACFTPAGTLVHDGRMVIPYSANPQKQSWLHPGPPTPLYPREEFARRQQEWRARAAIQGESGVRRAVNGLVLREDGWARLVPAYESGRVLTKQFVFEGDSLRVNADCRYGYVRVELLDPCFQPYDGFSAQQCDPLIGAADQIWHTVRWQGGGDLRTLWDRPVRIRFQVHEASLYSFQFLNSENDVE
ncbi:MAG: hypothetical protein OXL39_10225 [Caldilineaceae bacterium]|nr:hypothetical protein [Caldilineaceae bacterium]